MSRPLVLITSIPRLIPTTLPGRMSNATVNERFGALIGEADGIPVAADAWTDPEALAERVDAIVLNGGTDVDPGRYGAKRAPTTDEPDRRRDDFEFGLVAAALERRVPVLGVCRGMQLVNVGLGGSLIQDLSSLTELEHYVTDPYDKPVHAIEIDPDSVVEHGFGSCRTTVNTVHRQAIDRLGHSLRPVARAPDGTIEAVENEDGLVVGVQWHPEFLAGHHGAAQVGLFKSFLARCGHRVEARL